MATRNKPKKYEQIEKLLNYERLSNSDLDELELLMNIKKSLICDKDDNHVIDCYHFDNQRSKVLYRLLDEIRSMHNDLVKVEQILHHNRGVR